MAAYDEVLSKQYHSLKIFTGTYGTAKAVSYRIGNTSKTIQVAEEKYYDTWIDFHMIPSDRPTVALPAGNTKLITIPGRSTPLDFSNYLTGHPTFGNRSGSWTFLMDNDFVNQKGGWMTFEKDLRNKLHGRIRKVVLRDDPSYFYVGELTLGAWTPGDTRSSITISYNFYPYKKALLSTMDMWAFDDFDFQDGFIQYLENMEVDSIRYVDVLGAKERISPHIAGSGDLSIAKYENGRWVSYGSVYTGSIEKADAIRPRLVIDEGTNRLRFIGNGTVTIDYRRGLL